MSAWILIWGLYSHGNFLTINSQEFSSKQSCQEVREFIINNARKLRGREFVECVKK
jgi:hypothetical protein